MQPKGNRQGHAPGGRQAVHAAGFDKGPAYGLFLSDLVFRPASQASLLQMGLHQIQVFVPEARVAFQSQARQVLIVQEPGRLADAILHGRQGGKPQVEVAVHGRLGKDADLQGQAQGIFIPPGQLRLFVRAGHALQQVAPGIVTGGIRRGDLQAAVAAQCAEPDTQEVLDVIQGYGRFGIGLFAVAGDESMPPPAHMFFHLHQFQEIRNSLCHGLFLLSCAPRILCLPILTGCPGS